MNVPWLKLIQAITLPVLGAGLGAYIAVVTVTARLDATMSAIEEQRIPLLVQVTSAQTADLRQRLWRAENYISELMGDELPPYREIISWDDLMEATRLADQESMQLIREFMEVVSQGLHCDPHPEQTGK